MERLTLTPDELGELTGRTRKPAQARALRSLGIEFRVRPDASIVVLRSHAESVLSGASTKPAAAARRQPDWSNVNAPLTPR